jgi:hypothetical protein
MLLKKQTATRFYQIKGVVFKLSRYNGDYTKEFDDATYVPNLVKWKKIVFDMAEDFYDTPLGTGEAPVIPSDICYPPNRLLCDRAVLNALTDIKRARDYHPIGETDYTKFASYIGYWLTRSKPFMLSVGNYNAEIIKSEKDGKLLKGAFNLCFEINELFIADFMLAVVLTRAKDINNDIQNANGTCSDLRREHKLKYTTTESMYQSLCYYLAFRTRGAQELELFLQGLLTCYVGASMEYCGNS